MAITKRCDRCGAQVPTDVRSSTTLRMDRRGEPLVSLDLCGVCSEQFDEWMLGPTADESARLGKMLRADFRRGAGLDRADVDEGGDAR